MRTETSALITSRTSPWPASGSDDQKINDSDDRCRQTSKLLGFAFFLIVLSIGGYFTADLLANKGESLKLIKPSNDHDDMDYISIDLSQDIRFDAMPVSNGANGQPQQRIPSASSGNTDQTENSDASMMKVTNCGQTYDVSADSESYQTDIRAVANYLKTYWVSYSSFMVSQMGTLSNGEALDPSCLQQKFEEGEVVCKDMQCVYNGECILKTTWDAVAVCKYMYFDIGGLKQQARPDRRACIASMLVEQWSESCWEHDHITNEMTDATFKWWKMTFTVSDDWELENCPCSV
eukprot:95371_1